MLESIISFIGPVIAFLAEKYGIIGTVLGYAFFVVAPIVTLFLEIVHFIVALTPTPKDDEIYEKVKAVWAKILPILELLPHSKIDIPSKVAAIVAIIKKGFAALKGAVEGWKSAEPPQQ